MIIGIEADHANKEQRSGVENVCYYLIEALKKTIPSEYQVILYSRNPLRGELAKLPSNWNSHVLPWRARKGWNQIRLSFEMLIAPPDIFFAPAQLIPFFIPKKTMVLIHDSAFLTLPKAYGFLSRIYLSWMNNRIVQRAVMIFVTAKANQEELEKWYSLDNKNIFIIPLAFDKKVFFPQNEGKIQEVKNKYNIKGKYLLSVGRLEEKKNTALIIEAYDKWREKGKTADLVLIGKFGKGITGQSARDAYEKAKYKNDIKIIPFVPLEELPIFYSGAEIFLFPSRYEGFGLPILEAMASGCPVIIADNTAMPEVAGGAALISKTGNLSDLVEKIEQITDNALLRDKMMALGLVRAGEFSWELSARKIWQVFEQTLPKT